MTTMTDREMLELAAKAAGKSGTIADYDDRMVFLEDGKPSSIEWNPLTDDGDALRLAVKLHIQIEHMRTLRDSRFLEVSAFPSGRGDCLACVPVDGDAYAATRRAIVSAAANLGKAMP